MHLDTQETELSKKYSWFVRRISIQFSALNPKEKSSLNHWDNLHNALHQLLGNLLKFLAPSYSTRETTEIICNPWILPVPLDVTRQNAVLFLRRNFQFVCMERMKTHQLHQVCTHSRGGCRNDNTWFQETSWEADEFRIKFRFVRKGDSSFTFKYATAFFKGRWMSFDCFHELQDSKSIIYICCRIVGSCTVNENCTTKWK